MKSRKITTRSNVMYEKTRQARAAKFLGGGGLLFLEFERAVSSFAL